MRRRALRRFRQRDRGLRKRAREAVRNGDVRPLRHVLAMVQQRSNVEVLDVDLHEHPEGWVYALRVLTAKGEIRDVFLDARTLETLHLEPGQYEEGIPLPPNFKGSKTREDVPGSMPPDTRTPRRSPPPDQR